MANSNRPLRFRAWDKKDKLMLDWNTLCQTAFNRYERPQEPEHTLLYKVITNHSATFVLMQFTGLLDKNGKEIYEGDIVIPDDGGEYFEQEYNEKTQEYEPVGKYEIYWVDEALCFWLRGGDDKEDASMEYSPFGNVSFEVIGNIYENPELIK